MKVLIVGSGTTGALVSSLLLKSCCCHAAAATTTTTTTTSSVSALSSSTKALSLSIWEKSRGCGGRMTTSRFDPRSDGKLCSVDTGAQYISHQLKYHSSHKHIYDDLLNASVLTPMVNAEIVNESVTDTTTKHYICPNGISSIAKYFVSNSGADLCLEEHLKGIKSEEAGVLAYSAGGTRKVFDFVFLTMPAPQILQLEGIDALLDEIERGVLEGVEYSSRFALAIKLPNDFEPPVTWTAQYVTDNPCVRFVCLDSRKRGIDTPPHTLLVHTSVPYGIQHLEAEKDSMIDDILEHVRQVLPWLPANKHHMIIKLHKWRYSQVYRAVEGEPGHMTLRGCPRVILCGDSFTHSNLDGCISSALKTIDSLSWMDATGR